MKRYQGLFYLWGQGHLKWNCPNRGRGRGYYRGGGSRMFGGRGGYSGGQYARGRGGYLGHSGGQKAHMVVGEDNGRQRAQK